MLRKFICEDKKDYKDTIDTSNPLNLIHPFRAVLCSPPSCGKSSLIKNLIINQDPPFQRIFIFHQDPDSLEYKDVTHERAEKPFPRDKFDNKYRNLYIIEDVPFSRLNKNDKIVLEDTLKSVSSHRNTSVIISCHDPYETSPLFRSMINVLCLWRVPDKRRLKCLLGSLGMSSKFCAQVLDKYLRSKYDFLMIDDSGSGAFLRLNGVSPLITELDDSRFCEDEIDYRTLLKANKAL